jgi:hypothetical protein
MLNVHVLVLCSVGAARLNPGATAVRSRLQGVARAAVVMGGKTEELDTAGFSEAAQGDTPLVVDVYAHWYAHDACSMPLLSQTPLPPKRSPCSTTLSRATHLHVPFASASTGVGHAS